MSRVEPLFEAILQGDAKGAVTATERALAAGADPMEIVTESMIAAMDEVGRRFECEEYFVPELLLSGRAMKGSLELLRPLLAARGDEPVGRVVIGTVKGDLHDIGKNLVGSMLEGGGFEVHDLGADVAPEKFVEAITAHRADLVALSALLTVTMPSMRTTIDAITQAGVRGKVRVIIGGAPVTADFANEIGADGYSDNASSAVALARRLMTDGHAVATAN
jgi:corrinoid protein of di/trimethylamine methyltransferase